MVGELCRTVIRYDPHLRAKYERIKAKGNNGKKTIVAVAHSLAIRLRRCFIGSDRLCDRRLLMIASFVQSDE